MISLHIISQELNQLKEISRILISENLIIQSHIVNNIITINSETEIKKFLCICNTRALLFGEIEKIIKLNYADKSPEIYSIPIVNMDWNQSRLIKDKTNNDNINSKAINK